MRFAEFFPADGAPSAADIRAAIERADAEKATTSARLEELTTARADALVRDDEKTLDRIEGDIARARRALDRADLATAELARRLQVAEEAERVAEIEASYQCGLAAQARGVELIRKKYRKLATDMARVLDELSDCEQAVHESNVALHKAGDPRQLDEIDFVSRPRVYRPQLGSPRLTDAVVLPHPEHPEITAFPMGTPPTYGEVAKLTRPARSWSDRPSDEQPVAPPSEVGRWMKAQPTW